MIAPHLTGVQGAGRALLFDSSLKSDLIKY